MARIELDGITIAFNTEFAALDHVSLDIADGEFLTLVGPSGSGKTTLIRIIAGLETHHAGSIRMDGVAVDALAPHRRDVAMVFQNPALYPHLDVRRNLAFGLRARHVSQEEAGGRIEQIAGRLGLESLLNRRPDELSGGERQRVALGRALVRRPRALLLDEPLSSLDASLRAELRTLLAELQRELRLTTLLVSHDQDEALALGHRVAVLVGGRMQQVDEPRSVHDRPANRVVGQFIGSPPMDFLPFRVSDLTGMGRVSLPPSLRGRSTVVGGFRPEHLSEMPMSEARAVPATDLILRGTVRRLEPKGHEVLGTMAVEDDGTTLHVRFPAGHAHCVGDALMLRVDVGRASWFDPESGLRID